MGEGIVYQQTIARPYPIHVVLVQKALHLSFVKDDIRGNECLSMACFHIGKADFVQAVTGKSLIVTDKLYVSEGCVKFIRTDGFHISCRSIQLIDEIVAGSENQVSAICHTGSERGERS